MVGIDTNGDIICTSGTPPTPRTPPGSSADHQEVLDILASTGVILPLVSDLDTNSFGTSFVTVGAEAATFTWGGLPFDTSTGFEGVVPVATFNGTDEEADTPDAAFWSRGDGSDDSVFSVGAWVNVPGGVDQEIFGKWETATPLREWEFLLDGANRVELVIYDESANAKRGRRATVAINVWTFLVATYDGSGVNGGIDLYENGTILSPSLDSSGVYTAMENLAGKPALGMRSGGPTLLFDGKMAGGPLGPFFTQKELSATEIADLHTHCKSLMGLP